MLLQNLIGEQLLYFQQYEGRYYGLIYICPYLYSFVLIAAPTNEAYNLIRHVVNYLLLRMRFYNKALEFI